MSTKILSDLGLKPRSEQEWQGVALFASGARTKATDEATTGAAVEIGDWDKLIIVHDITATAGDATTDTYAVTVEMSMDNLAWYHVGAFTVREGDEGALREQMVFIPGGRCAADPNALLIGSTACTATVVRNNLVGRYIRYNIAIADNGTNASFTASLTVALMRSDTVRNEGEIKEIELFSLLARTDALDDPVGVTEWEIGDSWEWMQLVLRTTNHDVDAGDHLDVQVDLSMDGTRWVNVAQFTQCNGDDGPWVELFTLTPGLADNVDASIVVTSDAGETVCRPGFAGAFLRARNTVTASGTDDETFTFSLKAYVK